MHEHLDLNLSHCEPIATPQELISRFPQTGEQKEFISSTRKAVKDILDGKDSRLLIIVGPCSIHDITAAKEYATKLHALSKKLEDQFLILMRVYLEKPRTSIGWKGLVYDPLINNTHDMHTGLETSRQLLLDLAALKVPVACEFLDVGTMYYLNDLISWGCIGARTTTSQIHRQVASGLTMPIGFKNNTDGNINVAVDGVKVASMPHTFIGMDAQGKAALLRTKGNSHCHIVLRGGDNCTNYDPHSLSQAVEALKATPQRPQLLIDCSHDNSNREYTQQSLVFQSVITQFVEGNKAIRGILLEGNLHEGRQALSSDLRYGVSITDSCLDWETTQKLLVWAHEKCKQECTQALAYP